MPATQKLPLVLLAVAVLGLLLWGCGGADARRASHIARGQKYLAEDNLEKARVEFADALQISPNNAEARFLSGRVAERLGNPRLAASMYQGAIDVDAEHVAARANLARLYVFSGMPDKALELVKPAIATHPEDPDLLTVRAAARAQNKDAAGALADAEHAVRVAPANENAVSTLVGLYQAAGQPSRAMETLEAALTKLPRSVDLRQVLARLYLAGGDRGAAEEQLLKVIEIRPKDWGLRLELVSFYSGAQRLHDAERTLKAAMLALPERDEAKLTYVDFLATHRSPAQGEAALRTLIAQDPRNLDLQLGLGALQQRTGDTLQAVATYRAVIAKDPRGGKGVMARDRIAAIETSAKSYDEASPLLADALKLNPHDDDALTLRGNIELERGDVGGAIADLRAVLRDQPAAVPVLRSLARAHLANHEPALAEENLRTALRAAPNDVGVRVDLGELLSRTQRAEEAIALLEEAVNRAPDAAGTAARAVLVQAYLAKPDLPAAARAAADLNTLRPDLAIGPYLSGLVAQRQKRLDDAQHEFEQALRLEPSATDVLAALARLEVVRGERAKAITLLHDAVARTPTSAVRHNLLGELYLAGQSYGEAIATLAEAVRLAPTWWLPYRNLALAKLAAKDEAGELAVYEAGVKATQEPVLVTDLAEIYVQRGRFEDAIHQYELLHERSPQLDLAANNLAMLLVTYRSDQGSLDRARDLTVRFANSDVGALLDTHGWVMLKRGDVPEALSALEKASGRTPHSKVILYHLGMAQLKAGQTEKARASLEAALADGASFTGTQEARLALAQLKRSAG